MIRYVSKKASISGATFIEALAVTMVIAAVLGAIGSSFTLGLRSYVGEYNSEARQLEVQRATAEIRYFGGKCSRFDTDGDSVTFYYNDGTYAKFEFEQTGMYDGSRLGQLSVRTPAGERYVYGVNVLADGSPFAVSDGGCSYVFYVDSAGGQVNITGLVYPSTVL